MSCILEKRKYDGDGAVHCNLVIVIATTCTYERIWSSFKDKSNTIISFFIFLFQSSTYLENIFKNPVYCIQCIV